MQAPIKVAIAGTGQFSRFHIDSWGRMADAMLVAGWNRNRNRAEKMLGGSGARIFDHVEAMLDDTRPGLLDIAGAPEVHLSLIQMAAERGIQVICQKPLCVDQAEAQQAVRIARDAGILLVVHENFRFQPWYREIRRQLDAGRIGEVIQAQFRLRPGDGRGEDAYLNRQPFFRDMPQFLVRETGVHLIDTFQYLFGPIAEVSAHLRQLNPAIKGEDAGHILMVHGTGSNGRGPVTVFDGNRHLDVPATDRYLTMGDLMIEGALGVLRLDGYGQLWHRDYGADTEQQIEYSWNHRGFGGDCVHALQSHVISHLLHATPLENQAKDYLRVQRIVEAVYQSNLDRRVIEVD